VLNRLNVAWERIRAFFHTRELDQDFEQEMESHLALLTEDNVHRGMEPGDARREAAMRLGGMEVLKEFHREARGLPFADVFVQDLRYACRALRRNAGFGVFAILIVGLGIGVCATMFCVVNALLLHLPFPDSGRLVWVWNRGGRDVAPARMMPAGHFLDLRDQTQTLSGLAGYFGAYRSGDVSLTGIGEPLRLTGLPITQNFFSVLGVQPALGRMFNTEECKTKWGAQGAVILSHSLWMNQFGSDPSIVGRRFTLADTEFEAFHPGGTLVTVIGVLPPSFDFASVFDPGNRIDLYLPLPLTEEVTRQGNSLVTIGRLKRGATIAQAQSEFNVLAVQIRRKDSARNFQPTIETLQEHVSGRLRPALVILACSVGMVMLIVCANLSNLLLARNATRQKEMAVRIALGAGRGRLIRQMLTESITLACCGSALGLILALAGTRLLSHAHAFNLPLLESVQFDLSALAFTLIVSLLTGLIFGLLPALQAPSVAVHDALKDASRGLSDSKRSSWIRNALVISEVALAYVLLVGAGLLTQSFLRVLDVDLGFRPESTVAVRIDSGATHSTQAQRDAYFDEAIRRASAVPGIRAAGLSDVLPLNGDRTWGVGAKGQSYSKDHPVPFSFVRVVSEGYLRTIGVSLRAGRYFTNRDVQSSEPVVLVNETLARTLWPGQNPIGQIMAFPGGRRVVGVVGDVRHRALEDVSGPEIYLPIYQTDDYSSVFMVVRTSLSSAACASAIREALRPIERTISANEFRTLQELVDRAASPRRFLMLLLAGFSAFSMILAALGIYAVISFSVSQRTAELGVRMALGASPREIKVQIMVQALIPAGFGMLIGIAAALVLGRALTALLFDVRSTDAATFFGMAIFLAAVATLTAYLPAVRASRIDPIDALRSN